MDLVEISCQQTAYIAGRELLSKEIQKFKSGGMLFQKVKLIIIIVLELTPCHALYASLVSTVLYIGVFRYIYQLSKIFYLTYYSHTLQQK